jgi:hypothetical protein
MEQRKTNQEHGKKESSKRWLSDQPSRAPVQDENPREFVDTRHTAPGRADRNSDLQGVSNRPANVEHAFPEPNQTTEAGPEEGFAPEQQGGNRGGV